MVSLRVGLFLVLLCCEGKMSKHVSFHARLTPVHGHIHAHAVAFDDVLTNEGAAYDPATGKFTAPVIGTYFFAFTASPHSLRHFSNCELMVDNRPVANIKTKYSDSDNYFNMATGHAVLQLDQGQIVMVNRESMGLGLSNQSFQPELSFFSGFLVSPGC